MHVRDHQGKQFGRLSVIERVGSDKDGKAMWRCLCACGTTCIVKGTSLHRRGITRGTQSCGCYHKERIQEVNSLRPYESAYNGLVHQAKQRGLENSIRYEDFLKFTKIGHCHYCWADIVWEKAQTAYSRAYHLDRMDSTQGYSTENCIVCCTRCNRGKNSLFTYSEWRAMTEIFRGEKEC